MEHWDASPPSTSVVIHTFVLEDPYSSSSSTASGRGSIPKYIFPFIVIYCDEFISCLIKDSECQETMDFCEFDQQMEGGFKVSKTLVGFCQAPHCQEHQVFRRLCDT